ncbi:hypothetical protein Taro_052739, partial [Colocasia esculenta]|nr:hypothetical protein [Colocasia esculenta]
MAHINGKARAGKHDATTRDRLLVHNVSIQPGQHSTRTTSQSRSHGHKVQLQLHNTSKAKELWRPTKPPQPTGHTPCRPMPGTFRDSGLSSLKVRHWKRTSWGPVSTTGVRTPTTSALQVTKRQVRQSLSHCRLSLSRTYNSNTGVRVSRSDDTDLDGTTQVPGQSPELIAWLIENLGHPTGE